jgi:hypothetical protein
MWQMSQLVKGRTTLEVDADECEFVRGEPFCPVTDGRDERVGFPRTGSPSKQRVRSFRTEGEDQRFGHVFRDARAGGPQRVGRRVVRVPITGFGE